jgi:hypothetical protein
VSGILRFMTAAAIAALFILAWVAVAWIVMLVTLYVVRAIPLTGRRREENRSRLG